MDPQWKRTLRKYQNDLRTGIIVSLFAPVLWKVPLTPVEFSHVNSNDNVRAVDKLIEILLTKTKKKFYSFCDILRGNGYEHWANTLEEEARSSKAEKEGAKPPKADESHVTGTPKSPREQVLKECESGLLVVKQDLVPCDLGVFSEVRNPHDAIRTLFCHAFSLLDQILKKVCHDTTTYLTGLKETVLHRAKVLHLHVDEEKVRQADAPRKVFQCLGVDVQWSDVTFLDGAVICIPDETEKKIARAILDHYRAHLRAYCMATPIKNGGAVTNAHVSVCEIAGIDRVRMEIKVDKDIKEFSCEDCIRIGNLFFGNSDHVQLCGAMPGCTLLVFGVPKTLAIEIEEKLSKPDFQWMMKELGICQVQVPEMFYKDMTTAISADCIRSGLNSGVNYISLTEHCSPLMKSLVSPQDMSLMDEGKYTGGFFRELTKTVPAFRRSIQAARQLGVFSSRGTHKNSSRVISRTGAHKSSRSALSVTLHRLTPDTSDFQTEELPQPVKHPLRDWRQLGECQKVILHCGGCYITVAVNGGLLAVTDEEYGCVHLLTKEGAPVRSIGEGVLGTDLYGVAFDLKGNVWVMDSGNNKIVKLSQDGQTLQTVHHASSESDPFRSPHGVSVSPKSLIYISDFNNHRITVHDEDGTFLESFGSKGSGPGCFDKPCDVAFGSDGLVYVVDSGNCRVSVWSAEGTSTGASNIRHFNTLYRPTCIAATSDNHLLISSDSAHTVMVYTLEGELVHEFGGYGADRGQFNFPTGLCVDDSGVVYVADVVNYRIQVF